MPGGKVRHKVIRGLFAAFLAMVLILMLETLYFGTILTRENTPGRKADVILVFTGAVNRVATGYRLANEGAADRLLISPSTPGQRRRYDRLFGLRESVVHLEESQSASTFQNALYSSRIIRKMGLHSVILVTSDFHMPRSMAMLRLFLPWWNVQIHMHMVHGDGQGIVMNHRFWRSLSQEMIDFWGSLLEYGSYQLLGKLR